MASLVPFNVDLTAHEAARLAAVLDALSSHWDPAEIYVGETEARRMLYTHLDTDQQAVYNALIAHDVLPTPPER